MISASGHTDRTPFAIAAATATASALPLKDWGAMRTRGAARSGTRE